MNSRSHQMCRAFADIERVRMGGYTVDLINRKLPTGKWRKEVMVKKDKSRPQEKGIYRTYVDPGSPGQWQAEFVVMVLKREAKELEAAEGNKYRAPTIRLDDDDIALAKKFQAHCETRSMGMDRTDGGQSNFMGGLGELGAKKHFGLPAELQFVEVGGDDGYDFILEGQRVDVKATKKGHWYMICNDHWTPGHADAYIHAEIEGGRVVRLGGWIWEEDFVKRMRLGKDINPGWTPNCKAVPITDMTSMEDIRNELRVRSNGRDGKRLFATGPGSHRQGNSAVLREEENAQRHLF